MYVNLANFIKTKRKEANLNKNLLKEQVLPTYSGSEKEQGKRKISVCQKVNQVLLMFGSKLVPSNLKEIEK